MAHDQAVTLSALGQRPTFRRCRRASALPAKADSPGFMTASLRSGRRSKKKSSEQHPAGSTRPANQWRRVVPERQAVGGHCRRARDRDDLAEMAGAAIDQPLVRDARRAEAEMEVDVAPQRVGVLRMMIVVRAGIVARAV